MRYSAPKQITWIVALILGVVGILANLASIPVITPVIGFWLLVVGWALMIIATITLSIIWRRGASAVTHASAEPTEPADPHGTHSRV